MALWTKTLPTKVTRALQDEGNVKPPESTSVTLPVQVSPVTPSQKHLLLKHATEKTTIVMDKSMKIFPTKVKRVPWVKGIVVGLRSTNVNRMVAPSNVLPHLARQKPKRAITKIMTAMDISTTQLVIINTIHSGRHVRPLAEKEHRPVIEATGEPVRRHQKRTFAMEKITTVMGKSITKPVQVIPSRSPVKKVFVMERKPVRLEPGQAVNPRHLRRVRSVTTKMMTVMAPLMNH